MLFRSAAKLAQLSRRLEEINRTLSSENVTNDMDNYRKLTRESAEIQPVVELYREYEKFEADLKGAQEMAADPEMRELAEAEIPDIKARLEGLEKDLQKQLLPKDPNDDNNIFLEVRAGTGGEEAALFAGELFRMYCRYAERNR